MGNELESLSDQAHDRAEMIRIVAMAYEGKLRSTPPPSDSELWKIQGTYVGQVESSRAVMSALDTVIEGYRANNGTVTLPDKQRRQMEESLKYLEDTVYLMRNPDHISHYSRRNTLAALQSELPGQIVSLREKAGISYSPHDTNRDHLLDKDEVMKAAVTMASGKPVTAKDLDANRDGKFNLNDLNPESQHMVLLMKKNQSPIFVKVADMMDLGGQSPQGPQQKGQRVR